MEDSRMKNAVVHNDEPRSNHGWSHGQNQQKSAGDWSYWKFSSILSFLAEEEFFKNSEWLWNAYDIQFSFYWFTEDTVLSNPETQTKEITA